MVLVPETVILPFFLYIIENNGIIMVMTVPLLPWYCHYHYYTQKIDGVNVYTFHGVNVYNLKVLKFGVTLYTKWCNFLTFYTKWCNPLHQKLTPRRSHTKFLRVVSDMKYREFPKYFYPKVPFKYHVIT